MFDQTFVDHAHNAKEPFALSLLLETIGIGVLILLPLIYTQSMPNAQLKNLLTAPAAPTAPVKTPAATKPQHMSVARRFSAFLSPTVIPKRINTNIDDRPAVPAPDIAITGAPETTAGNGLLPGGIASVPQAPAPALPEKPKPVNAPVRIATGVAEANLIHKVLPVYPPLAKSARVQGVVEFTAIISREGYIQNLRLVRGHPLLVQAAKDAVLQWRYHPTLLNGQPVEVVTSIIVNFTLSQ